MRHLAALSLRARLTLAATLVAAVGLAIGGALTLVILERSLLGALEESARGDGRDIAALVDAGRLSDPLPTFGAAVAQVVDADGRVRASTPGGDRLTSIVAGEDLEAVRAGEAVSLPGSRLGDAEPYRVVGVPAGPPSDPQLVLVAVSLAEQQRGSGALRVAVVLVAVALAAGVAALSWFGIGRALRPVEALRRGAAEVTGTGGSRRLPVPDAEDEIRRLATTLNDMLARLDAATARQRAFVGDAAHELRSPIAALRTQLEVALAHPDVVDAHDTAREALAEVTRMSRLVDDLLVLARADDAQVLRAERADLAAITSDVVERLGPTRVPVTVDAPAPVAVRGDTEALRRVVRNLVDNAVRHAGTQVAVTVARTAGRARLCVVDDGPGVDPADRDRIFDRFTRLDHARDRAGGGAGLGLAIVARIVLAHDGTVVVEDAAPDGGAGRGSRFVVDLPGRPAANDSSRP